MDIGSVNAAPAFSSDIIDAESALWRAGAIQAEVAYTLRIPLFEAVDRVTLVTSRVATLSVLLDQTIRLADLPVVPASVTAIRAILVTCDDEKIPAMDAYFATTFANDGPTLGASLAQSTALQGSLTSAGFPLDAPVMYPVYSRVTVTDADGNATQTDDFLWVSADQRASLNGLETFSDVTDAPLIKRYTAPDFTMEFWCFDAFANRRVSLSALSSTISDMYAARQGVVAELQQVLTFGSATIQRCSEVIANADSIWRNFVGTDDVVRERRKDERILDIRLDELRRIREWAQAQLADGSGIGVAAPSPTIASATPATLQNPTLAQRPADRGENASVAAGRIDGDNSAASKHGASPSMEELLPRFFATHQAALEGALTQLRAHLPAATRDPARSA